VRCRKEIQAQIRFVSNLLIAINPDLAAPPAEGVGGAAVKEEPLSATVATPLNLSTNKSIASRVQLNILKKVKKAAAAAAAAAASEKEKKEERSANVLDGK
jgi:hypothetical protein